MQGLNAPVLQGLGGGEGLPATFNLCQPRQEDQNTAPLRLVEGVLLDARNTCFGRGSSGRGGWWWISTG